MSVTIEGGIGKFTSLTSTGSATASFFSFPARANSVSS